MEKIKVGVVFGGMSTEHDVSIVSGTSVIRNLNTEKYEVLPIYIDKEGAWNKYTGGFKTYKVGDKLEDVEKIDNVIDTLKQLDVVFPVLHGLYGEDGSIQGLFELLNIPYVGCKVLGSSVGMDKAYTKIIFDKANIKQAKYEYIREYNGKYIYIDKEFNETIYELDDVCILIDSKLTYPMFIKPSNSGSSVGVNKSNNREELKEHIKYATKFDKKVLIEESIVGREIECSVLRK